MNKLSRLEWPVLFFVFGLVLLGFVLLLINEGFFVTYTYEDGFIEWLTVIGLLVGAAVSFYRGIALYKWKRGLFSFTNILLGLLLFFAAGEEISWGQRIFGIESSEYFQKNNTQGETNIHNLVVVDVRLNKVVFSFVLIAVLAIFLVVVPIIYRKNKTFKNFVDRAGVVIPQVHQVIGFVVLFLLTSLIPHDKNAELLEFGAAFIFSLTILFPANSAAFNKNKYVKKKLIAHF